MKSVLNILSFLLFLAISMAIAGFFLPKQQKFVQKIEISVPRQIVYEQISDFQNWKTWSPWLLFDSAMTIKYEYKTKGQLATMNWNSKSFGQCKLTILHDVSPESIAVDFNYGTDSKTTSLWYVEPTTNGCKLNWTYNITDLSFFERYFALFQKKQIEKIISFGLENIERRCIELKYSRTGGISIIDMPAIPAVVLIDFVRPEHIHAKFKKNDAYLKRFFERRKLKPAGKSFKLVFGMVNDTLEKYGYGYPLHERTWVWKTLKYIKIPKGKVLTISHFGRQINTAKAHIKVEEYMELNGFKPNGYPWEIYLFNSETDIDTSLWETQIYFPVKVE